MVPGQFLSIRGDREFLAKLFVLDAQPKKIIVASGMILGSVVDSSAFKVIHGPFHQKPDPRLLGDEDKSTIKYKKSIRKGPEFKMKP